MKEQKYWWKVVINYSLREKNTFYSSTVGPPEELSYKIGHKTTAKFGKIFIFDTVEHAKTFMFCLPSPTMLKILKVVAHGKPKKLICCLHPGINSDLKSFWESGNLKYPPYPLQFAPIGTYGVKSITPVEISH
jgi:hypothetical protein